MQQVKADQMRPDWSNSSSNQSAGPPMKPSAVHLEERQEHLEKRMESLENVLVEMNVFLARISAEVLSLRVGSSSPMKKGTHIASLEQHDKIPSSRMHSLSEALSFFEDRKKQPYQTDLQQEESGESYSFQFSDKGLLSSPSDRSSNGSYESGKDALQGSSKIPVYKGERDAEIIWAWLEKVENYFEVGQATEDEKVLIATYHLKEGAYYWWKNLKARNSGNAETISSWEEFRKVFLKSFMPVNYLREAKFALMDLRQVKSVKEYSYEFCRLVHRVPCLAEEDKVAYYVHGLKCNVRMDMDDHNPHTLEEAMRLGEVSEAKKYAWKTG